MEVRKMKRIKLVIADFNNEYLNTLEEFFRDDAEIELLAAINDGNELLKALDIITPDALLLDLVLYGMDGIGVLEQIKLRANLKNMKIIVTSTFGTEGIIKQTIKYGADYCLIKPANKEQLLNRIKELAWCEANPESFKFNNASIIKEPKAIFTNPNDTKLSTIELLHELGVPAHIKGYRYLIEAVNNVYNNADLLDRITTELYPIIADKFNSTKSRVERAIRHAIFVTWTRGNSEMMEDLFGSIVDITNIKPTNSEFISMIAAKVELEFKKLNTKR